MKKNTIVSSEAYDIIAKEMSILHTKNGILKLLLDNGGYISFTYSPKAGCINLWVYNSKGQVTKGFSLTILGELYEFDGTKSKCTMGKSVIKILNSLTIK